MDGILVTACAVLQGGHGTAASFTFHREASGGEDNIDLPSEQLLHDAVSCYDYPTPAVAEAGSPSDSYH